MFGSRIFLHYGFIKAIGPTARIEVDTGLSVCRAVVKLLTVYAYLSAVRSRQKDAARVARRE